MNTTDGLKEVVALFVNFLAVFFYANALLTAGLYLYARSRRQMMGFQDGIHIAQMASGFIALICGVVLIYQFPFHYVNVTIASTLIGMAAGVIFGALFHHEALLSGYAHGMMMGLMSPMIGAAAKNSFPFLLFVELFFMFSLVFVFHFIKKRNDSW